jgi:hypothetical protein
MLGLPADLQHPPLGGQWPEGRRRFSLAEAGYGHSEDFGVGEKDRAAVLDAAGAVRMAAVRIVGGPRDGFDAPFLEGRRDAVLSDPSKMSILDPFTPPTVVPTGLTRYTLRRLHGPDDWLLEYLAPEDWSDGQALDHMFRHYRGVRR